MSTQLDSSKSDNNFPTLTSSLKSPHLNIPNSEFMTGSSKSESKTVHSINHHRSDSADELSHVNGISVDDIECWKEKYLKLERIHQQTITELKHQLNIKNQQIQQLRSKLQQQNTNNLIHTQIAHWKFPIHKSISMCNQQPSNTINNIDYPDQDSLVDSFSHRELDLENQLFKLSQKLEQMEIEKRYSHMKEEEMERSSVSLNRELKRMRSKEKGARFEKGVNTEESESWREDKSEKEKLSIDYLKSRLLKLMQSNIRLTKHLKQDSPSSTQTKSSITTPKKPQQQSPSSIGLSIILTKPLDLSKISLEDKNNSMIVQKSHSDRVERTGVNKTWSAVMTPKKGLSGRERGGEKDKWVMLRGSLEELKSQNKVLRRYMEMK